ncbi:MAG: hypothetical protein IJV07_00805, partial [Alphaproteobacteria bacterium]|nr:hypothetical protein [Alphaproteobacteria bacterium]
AYNRRQCDVGLAYRCCTVFHDYGFNARYSGLRRAKTPSYGLRRYHNGSACGHYTRVLSAR